MSRTIVILSIFCIISCKSQKKQDSNEMTQLERDMPVTLVLSDLYGGTEIPEMQVIRKESDLKSYFAEINRTRKPGLPMPNIDFENEIVLIYCSGKTTQPELPKLYPMKINEDELVIGIKPPADSLINDSSTATLLPFGIYKMPKTEKQVTLDKNKI